MRPDVKLGVVISLVVVLVAGGYYLYRDSREVPIPVVDQPAVSKPSGGPVKVATTAAPREQTPPIGENKSIGTRRVEIPTPSPKRTTVSTPPADPASRRSARGRPHIAANRRADEPSAGSSDNNPAEVSETTTLPPAPATKRSRITPRSLQPHAPRPTDEPESIVTSAESTDRLPDESSTSSGLRSSPTLPQPTPRNSKHVAQPEKSEVLENLPEPVEEPTPRRSSSPVVATSRAPAAERYLSGRPAREAGMEQHRIQPGDTLASLAKDYYGNEKYVSLLVEQNPQIADPHRLRVGMEVNVPPFPTSEVASATPASADSRKPAQQADAATRTYTVRTGDSFYAIARNVLGDASRWEEVYAMNKDLVNGDPKRLKVGQVVTLPQ